MKNANNFNDIDWAAEELSANRHNALRCTYCFDFPITNRIWFTLDEQIKQPTWRQLRPIFDAISTSVYEINYNEND